jgi:hypothetical protein
MEKLGLMSAGWLGAAHSLALPRHLISGKEALLKPLATQRRFSNPLISMIL